MTNEVLPSKSIELTILGEKFNVPFPKSGQYIDIHSLKGKIANDNYSQLVDSTDQFTGYARLLVDMIATFNVLIPDLKERINVSSILGMEMMESKILLDVYIKQWTPFYNKWMDIVTAPIVTEEVKSTPAA